MAASAGPCRPRHRVRPTHCLLASDLPLERGREEKMPGGGGGGGGIEVGSCPFGQSATFGLTPATPSWPRVYRSGTDVRATGFSTSIRPRSGGLRAGLYGRSDARAAAGLFVEGAGERQGRPCPAAPPWVSSAPTGGDQCSDADHFDNVPVPSPAIGLYEEMNRAFRARRRGT